MEPHGAEIASESSISQPIEEVVERPKRSNVDEGGSDNCDYLLFNYLVALSTSGFLLLFLFKSLFQMAGKQFVLDQIVIQKNIFQQT